jgi:hypothetical protein
MQPALLKPPKRPRANRSNRAASSVLINWRNMVQLPTGIEQRMQLGQRVYFLMKGDRLIVQVDPVLWSAGRYVSTRVRRCVAQTGLRRALARGVQ